MQDPSICRMVSFNQGSDKQPNPMPAVVQEVNGNGTVRLCAFGPTGILLRDNVSQGDGHGQWQWPVILPKSVSFSA